MRTAFWAALLLALAVAVGPSAAQDATYLSPRIRELAAAIEARTPNATADFWREIEARGAPLVEPESDSDRHRYVTFVWRGDASTRNVVLVCCDNSQLANAQYLPLGRLQRLGATDVWFRTYRLRDDAQFSYRFSPNDPLTLTPEMTTERNAARTAGISSDPLNPHQVTTRNGPAALLELPRAPHSPWIEANPSIAHGAIEQTRFTSQRLSNERDLWIYTPAGDPCRRTRCDVLFVLDGDGYLQADRIPVPIILDNLIAARRLRPTLAVLIGNADGARLRDLWHNDDFNAFLADELMPWVRARYRVTQRPSHTILAGASLGGTAVLYAGIRRPDVFGGVIVQSGGFASTQLRDESWPQRVAPGQLLEEGPPYEWFAREIATHPSRPLNIYMEIGLIEDVQATPPQPRLAYPSNLLATRHMRDVLEARGHRVTYHEFNGHHEHHSWRQTFADALLAVTAE